MKVLIVGGGGREHALANALARSPQRPELLAAPGNPGIAAVARCFPEVKADDVDGLTRLAVDEGVGLVVIGPEAPLVAGLADRLERAGVPHFGPSAAAARLEGSKAFAKEVMASAGVPTANWSEVETVAGGMEAIDGRYPTVIKFDGLAAGKGVVVAPDEATARAALTEMLEARRFGDGPVVVEEFLEGEELSLFAICDGERAVPMVPAQDYKRIFDGDEGPNTGGMGAYSPVVGAPDPDAVVAAIHQPVVDLLRERGTPFHGVLYAGLMLTADGPQVIEFNVRFGDPETQGVLKRLTSDLLETLLAATRPGGLAASDPMTFSGDWAVTLVLASRGYPESSSSGDVISGLDAVPADVEVTHAGTARDDHGAIVTAGGRVLNVTALGADPAAARERAYAAADLIQFDGRQLRRDIAQRAVERVTS
ncbi:MAG TPA: phosphoribosylamine--glycine ligase [Baekduia sp.]|uniref:phosphoribosylamine--glycine ligase n=1 Tax=Baekduia sp. TaxID=2600305 RepID=UPI002D77567D|nr:phosphoribosylamine--glycine ligase [Baekduia sp.]HET6509776.1 phosphoribosylamine--glycine ligase [Baekduia sp.]